MAVSASFHRNVFLLNQMVPPSDDFKKVFREGMFDKPNTAGFIHVSHYLLMIYDAEHFKRLVEWPVICKKTEVKYRNDVKDYLNVIALENPDIGLPHVVTTHLHHASGTKFTTIMWKLSQVALKKYIMRDGKYEIVSAPKLGPTSDLATVYLQQSIADIANNISSHHTNCVQMEKATSDALAEETKQLDKIKTELFDRKQSVARCTDAAPVAASIKQRLANVEDSEVIQMWKNSIDQNICYIRKQNAILKDLERVCENISDIISNLSNDAKTLDGKQLKNINLSTSELPFSSDVQHCFHHLYKDDKLVYHNFIRLLTLILHEIYQYLKDNNLVDLSPCLPQVEASVEDMKSMYNVFKIFLTGMKDSIEKTQSVLCEGDVEHTSRENILPFIKNVLFTSPLIKINTNCAHEKNDLNKLLQFTPKEIVHKPLFSRYGRHKRDHPPDLRTNLFVSRINVDNIISLGNNEKQGENMRFATPKVNHLSKIITGKYSRLFSTRMNRNVKANSSIMSLPSTKQANSSVIASATGEMSGLSDLNLDITARDLSNLSKESFTFSHSSMQFTPIKRNISRDVSQEAKDKCDREIKINKLKFEEFTEIQFTNDENKGIVVKHENAPKRRSISDLVERYKKLLEVSNSATIKFQNECIEHEIE